jgi:hypothetical protein
MQATWARPPKWKVIFSMKNYLMASVAALAGLMAEAGQPWKSGDALA